ncbi:MAG: hypothetical protein ISS82_03610 [Nanoarchaeota archaeon]|nr:hypothetical protein [Nanoarchaeota archaeon]
MKRDDIIFFKTRKLENLDFFSNSPPQVFIGSKLYPRANVGVLSPSEPLKQVQLLYSPNAWTSLNLSIKQILNLRNQLINSRFQINSMKESNKFLDKSKEVGMAYKPTDLEIHLKKTPNYNKENDKITAPINLVAPLKTFKITENPKIHRKVDKVVDDIDLKAKDALMYLYKNNFNEHFLQQLLSIGVLGLKKNRKIVPTRFSITATDDTIGKELIKEIKNYPTIDDNRLFYDKYLGNHYFILLLPNLFSYELFEYGLKYGKLKGAWTDFEDYFGRKTYASSSVGGYYSVRLSVLEYLKKIKRQASVFIIRYETEEYWANLGVWVTRNCSRRAMNKSFISFYSREHALDFMKNFIFNKLKQDVTNIFKRSKLLNMIKEQKALKEFF